MTYPPDRSPIDPPRSPMTERRLPPGLEEKGETDFNVGLTGDHSERWFSRTALLDWLYGKKVPVYVDDVFAGHETTPDLAERMRARAYLSAELEHSSVDFLRALRAELGMDT